MMCKNFIFNLLRNCVTFKVAAPFTFPPAGYESSIIVEVKWYLIILVICISLMTNAFEQLFSIYWLFVHFLWRNVYLDPLSSPPHTQILHFKNCLCLFLKLGYLYFHYWVVKLFIYFRYKSLIQIYDLQIFSPILWFVFSFSW